MIQGKELERLSVLIRKRVTQPNNTNTVCPPCGTALCTLEDAHVCVDSSLYIHPIQINWKSHILANKYVR